MSQIDYSKKIKSLALLGYSVAQIADMLNLPSHLRQILISRISTPDDSYNLAYRHGVAIGNFKINKELASNAAKGHTDSIEILDKKMRDNKISELKQELFGI